MTISTGRGVATAAALAGLCLTIGRAIVLMPGFSIGLWIVYLAPALLCIFVLFIVNTRSAPSVRQSWTSLWAFPGEKDLRALFGIIPLSAICGLLVLFYGVGLTVMSITLCAVGGITVSYIFMASEKESGAVFLFILALPFVNFLEFEFGLFYESYHGIFYTMPSIIASIIFGFVFLIRSLLKKQSLAKSPFNKVWIILFVPMLVSAIFSHDHVVSLRNTFYFVATSIPFFLVVNTVRTVYDLRLATIFLALSAGLRAMFILYFEIGKLAGGFAYDAEYLVVPSYQAVLATSVVLCCFLLLAVIGREWSRFQKYSFQFVVLGILTVCCLKFSRSAVIGVGIGALTLAWLRGAGKAALAGLLTGAVLLFVSWDWVVAHSALGRFEDFVTTGSFRYAERQRIDAYQAAFSIIRDFPWFGIGPVCGTITTSNT